MITDSRDFVTKMCIAICVGVYVLQTLNPQMVSQYGLFAVPLSQQGYYRIFTYAFLHGSVSHILVNMISLYNIGSFVEDYIGRRKYLTIILVSLITSGWAVVLLSQAGTVTVGFSGVIFGLFGVFVAIMIKTGAIRNPSVSSTIMRMLIPNIIISLFPGVFWQGHLGGFAGGVIAGMLSAERK